MRDSTIYNLRDVTDSAVAGGVGEHLEARFARDDLDAETIGLSHQVIKPGKRQPFGHRHENAEEIYVVIGGSGRVKLGDEVRELRRLDAVRVAPGVARAFEADTDGLEFIVFGPYRQGDAKIVEDFWPA